MRCLNCRTGMTNYKVVTKNAELAYDVCEKCGSLWLDRGELDKMAFQVTGSIEFCSDEEAKIAKQTSKNCPRCLESQLTPFGFWAAQTSSWTTVETAADSGSMEVSLILLTASWRGSCR